MPETLEEKLAKIEKAYNHIKEAFKASMQPGGEVFASDFLIIGAAKRTLALSDGFCSHIRARNFTCAGALLRLQLDTALRVFAATLVNDPEEYAQAIFDGKQVDRLKDKNGERLTDSYLAKRLSEDHHWVAAVYKDLCDFVHLSNRHIFGSIAKLDDDRTVYFQVSAKDPLRPEEAYFEIVNAFFETMRLTVGLAEAWQMAKRLQAETKNQPSSPPPATGG